MNKILLKTILFTMLAGGIMAADGKSFLKTQTKTGITTANPGQKIDPSTIQVYPNPSDGRFSIKHEFDFGEIFSVRVFNVIGEVIYEENYTSKGSGQILKIELHKEPQGLYFVKVGDDEEGVTKKMVIKK